mmetsp:Transcript_23624/g.48892  ORF Transcript_23624/g.48892 Transcript_23624/m.48892 type:complete len:218 (+) Transcript_23624:446-1099(+)
MLCSLVPLTTNSCTFSPPPRIRPPTQHDDVSIPNIKHVRSYSYPLTAIDVSSGHSAWEHSCLYTTGLSSNHPGQVPRQETCCVRQVQEELQDAGDVPRTQWPHRRAVGRPLHMHHPGRLMPRRRGQVRRQAPHGADGPVAALLPQGSLRQGTRRQDRARMLRLQEDQPHSLVLPGSSPSPAAALVHGLRHAEFRGYDRPLHHRGRSQHTRRCPLRRR